ncbi:MAG TPA: hypothetical protein VMS64_13870 [Candidatus Methylomirabilis sp.]|nr:hypothetical protein [Candidatus Methylomirabilis sp.]
MTTVLLEIVVAAIPLGVVVGLLRLVDWRQERRDECHARQVMLTDAIHREMGAAAAPTVERRRRGGYKVQMMVSLDRPAVVAAILRVTHHVLASSGRVDQVQIVLIPRPAGSVTTAPGSARRRPLRSGASIAAVAR